jgi:plasmid stabilization system protein ParE
VIAVASSTPADFRRASKEDEPSIARSEINELPASIRELLANPDAGANEPLRCRDRESRRCQVFVNPRVSLEPPPVDSGSRR